MKRIISVLIATIIITSAFAQKKQPATKTQANYKEYNVCIDSAVYKGKKNHGQFHCVSWARIREYKNGRKDTVMWSGGGNIFIGDEYESYKKLTERGKYIVDSLKEDGVTQLQQLYLTYEPIYMPKSKKVEQLWRIRGDEIVVYSYLFWHNNKGSGIKLLKEVIVQ